MMAVIFTLLIAASASQPTAPPTAQELGYPAGCKAIYGGAGGKVHLIKVSCPGPDLSKLPAEQPASEDEAAHVTLFPGPWSAALSTWEGRTVDRRDVRKVSCVGLEVKQMLCSWDRRTSGSWRAYSAWTDLSNDRAPRILEAVPPKN